MAEPAAGGLRALQPEQAAAGEFWSGLVDCFGAAAAARGAIDRDLEVAGVRLRLRFAGPALAEVLFPAFAHLSHPAPGEEPERTVLLWDTASTGVGRPPDAWGRGGIGALGELTGLEQGPLRGVWYEAYEGLQIWDSRSATLAYHVRAAAHVPWYERAAPMRPGLHWLLGEPGRHLVHAAAVGEAGRGLLLAGRAGSGKSTLAMACLEAGLEFAGEDYVVVDAGEEPLAHSLYATAKLDLGSLGRLPDRVRAGVNLDFADEEKAVIPLAPSRLARAVPISGVLLPRVSGAGRSRLERASGAEAALALAPSSIFQLPGRSGGPLALAAQIARSVPAWHLELGDDLDAAVACVRSALRES